MKYLSTYKIFESNFLDRDKTDYARTAIGWTKSPYRDEYSKIEEKFNISSEDLGYILLDFLEYHDLVYQCDFVNKDWARGNGENMNTQILRVTFYPNCDYPDNGRTRAWINRKENGEGNWNWKILNEIESRLNDYNLTCRLKGKVMIYLTEDRLTLMIYSLN